jgi:septin family protein
MSWWLVSVSQRLSVAFETAQYGNLLGESGLGKTTFMNTLFNTDLVSDIVPEEPTKTLKIRPVTYELMEENTTLQLTVIDTPGFGDRLDRSEE